MTEKDQENTTMRIEIGREHESDLLTEGNQETTENKEDLDRQVEIEEIPGDMMNENIHQEGAITVIVEGTEIPIDIMGDKNK